MVDSTMVKEQLIDLGTGISIWKVHIGLLKEQDKNARAMSNTKYNRLADNIKKDARLESLPLCTPNESDGFDIISGHHRVRAARTAGVTEIHVMVFNEALSDSEVKAKQLAHNALAGVDDPQLVKEIYEAIQDIQAKMASGITEDEMAEMEKQVSVDNVMLQVDFEVVNIMFFPEHKKTFERMLGLLTADTGENIFISEIDTFQEFKEAIMSVSKNNNVRNLSTVMNKMSNIIKEYYGEEIEHENWHSIANLLGTSTIPLHVSRGLTRAIDKAMTAKKIKKGEKWKILETLLEDYLDSE